MSNHWDQENTSAVIFLHPEAAEETLEAAEEASLRVWDRHPRVRNALAGLAVLGVGVAGYVIRGGQADQKAADMQHQLNAANARVVAAKKAQQKLQLQRGRYEGYAQADAERLTRAADDMQTGKRQSLRSMVCRGVVQSLTDGRWAQESRDPMLLGRLVPTTLAPHYDKINPSYLGLFGVDDNGRAYVTMLPFGRDMRFIPSTAKADEACRSERIMLSVDGQLGAVSVPDGPMTRATTELIAVETDDIPKFDPVGGDYLTPGRQG